MNKIPISAGTLYQKRKLQIDVCNHFTVHRKSKIIYDDTWLRLILHQFSMIVTISDVYWCSKNPKCALTLTGENQHLFQRILTVDACSNCSFPKLKQWCECVDMISLDLWFHAFVHNSAHCKDKHTAEQITTACSRCQSIMGEFICNDWSTRYHLIRVHGMKSVSLAKFKCELTLIFT